jgi:hypothetical protein
MCSIREFAIRFGFLTAVAVAVSGCNSSKSADAPKAGGGETNTEVVVASAEKGSEEAAKKPFVLGDLIDPFTPPPLEEIERTANWSESPVRDGLTLMREHQNALGPPQLTPAEALLRHNDSNESNRLIRDALGRMAPEDNSGVNFDAEIVLVAPVDLKTTNPFLASSVVDFDYSSHTGFGLFGFDWEMNPFGSKDAIVSWQTSEDKLSCCGAT